MKLVSFKIKKLTIIILFILVPFIFISCKSQKRATQDNVKVDAPAVDTKTQSKDKPVADKTKEVKEFKVHVVQQGESLSTIAKMYNVTVDAIVKLNNISNADFIVVGQELKIPEPGGK
jgi:LysM repeat protein